jgi:hypothetical protein
VSWSSHCQCILGQLSDWRVYDAPDGSGGGAAVRRLCVTVSFSPTSSPMPVASAAATVHVEGFHTPMPLQVYLGSPRHSQTEHLCCPIFINGTIALRAAVPCPSSWWLSPLILAFQRLPSHHSYPRVLSPVQMLHDSCAMPCGIIQSLTGSPCLQPWSPHSPPESRECHFL